jgi:uncharacterized membrane protein
MNATPPQPSPPAQTSVTPAGAAPPTGTPPRDGWAVGANRGVAWWSDGWRLFKAAPVVWIVITLLYLVVIICLHFVPLLGQIASTILTPVLAGGVLLGCRALDRGGELTIGHLFAGFSERTAPLLVLGALFFVGGLLVTIVVFGVGAMLFGMATLSAMASAQSALEWMAMFGGSVLAWLVIAFLVAIPVIMACWYAPALVALRAEQPIAALGYSLRGILRNIPPVIIYHLLGIVFAIVATIPFGLGWFVLAPVLVASVYASYKDIFGD